MKYLKYYLFVLLVLIGILVSGSNEVKDVDAFTSSFDYSGISPRFQYLRDEGDITIPFQFEMFEVFDSPKLASESNYFISLEQVTYDGAFIKQLNYYYPEFELLSSNLDSFTYGVDAISVLANSETVVLYDRDLISIDGVEVEGATLGSTSWSYEFSELYDNYVVTINEGLSAIGDLIEVHYTAEANTDYVANIFYSWEGIQWDDNNIIFYQLKIDNLVIWTGAVMQPPQDNYLPYDVYGLEVGEFLVVGDGTVDSDLGGFTDQSQFTSYEDDRYIILHYRIPIADYLNYKTIRVTDIINNVLIDAISTEDILGLQFGATEDHLNSFVVIPIDNVISEGLSSEFSILLNDRFSLVLDEDYTEGSYYFAIDDGGTLLDGASVVWNIVEDDNNPMELILAHSELTLNTKQRATFYKYSSVIYEGYNTIYAKDLDVNISFIEPINSTLLTYSIEYYPDLDLVEGDTSSFGWRVSPDFMPYSLAVNDFTINMSEDYIYGAEKGVEADIESLRTAFGMSDTTGGIIFSIFILAFVNGALMFITRATFIFAVSNVSVLGVLSFFSLIPMWFIMAVVLIAFLGIRLSSGGGNSYE